MADGGEGTLDVVKEHLDGAAMHRVMVSGPLGATTEATILQAGADAWVEMAQASGLTLCRDGFRPLEATSLGTGEAMLAASRLPGVERVIVAIGGSASTDGGTGAAAACGWRFEDRSGHELARGGGSLTALNAIVSPPDLSAVDLGASVLGAYDVDSQLVGEGGAARAFSPQKGATPAEVATLEAGIRRLADLIRDGSGRDVASLPGSGAGGGLGAGLVAFFGAGLVAGADLVAGTVRLVEKLRDIDLVITGEGAYDAQSARGKVAATVARIASDAGVDCALIAGRIEVDSAAADSRSLGISAASPAWRRPSTMRQPCLPT